MNAFGFMPIILSTSLPFLYSINVGMDIMPYCSASSLSSSMFTLQNFILPSSSTASSDIIGAIILHGPHHDAQKSTRTGMFESITSSVKVSWVRFFTSIIFTMPFRARSPIEIFFILPRRRYS